MFKDTTGFLDATPVEAPADIELKPWQSILLKAADLIEQKGWTRHKYKSQGRHCALGAIRASAGLSAQPELFGEKELMAEKMLLKAIQKSDWMIDSIPDWNDYYAKNTKAVVATMREVALKPARSRK